MSAAPNALNVGGVPSPRVRAPKRGEGTPPTSCRHCGATLIDARMQESGFCCAGCRYVFRLVHEHGLDGYYRIKDDVTTPADAAVFQPHDYPWLETAQREAEASTAAIPELTLNLQGISCAGCVWLIERVFQQQAGARDIFVNAHYGSMRLRWVRGVFSAAEFAQKLQAFSYAVGPAGNAIAEPETRGLVKRIGLCAAFTMNVMLFAFPTYFGMERTFEYARLFGLLAFAFGTMSLLVGGTYFIERALRALREKALHIDLPISLGIVGAYSGSFYGWLIGDERFVYFDFVSTFILLMLIGRWAQVAAVERNRRRLLSDQPKPPQIRLKKGGEIPPEKIRRGETILLGAGQMLPVDSCVAAEASFSLASINGEAEPRVFQAGQRVPSGSINVTRSTVELTALQAWEESLLAQLLAPGERKSWRQTFLEKVVRGYLGGILAVAALAGIGWWWATGDALRTGAVVTAVLVVSCPCAIALAFPLADEIATVALRRRGVFVRETDLWAKLGQVRQIVFDKTGTLTLETPLLKNPAELRALDAPARRALLNLVRDNAHPTSQCLFAALLADGGGEPLTPADPVHETVGFGVESGAWSLGRAGWRAGIPTENAPTVFAQDGQVLACFQIAHTLRPDARAEVSALRSLGFEVQILSGDRRAAVDRVAAELGLPRANALAELSPREKAEWIDDHAAKNALMLGDGANDSLAFDRAFCRGTPVIHRGVLQQKADFYYLGQGIAGIRALFEVNAVRRRMQTTILIFSIAYNLFAVGLAVAGRMNPLVAAALMPVNSLLTLAIVTIGMRRVLTAGARGRISLRPLQRKPVSA
jgi:P-type Cu2+ transporter